MFLCADAALGGSKGWAMSMGCCVSLWRFHGLLCILMEIPRAGCVQGLAVSKGCCVSLWRLHGLLCTPLGGAGGGCADSSTHHSMECWQGHRVLVSLAKWYIIIAKPGGVPAAVSLPWMAFSWSIYSLATACRLLQSINFWEREGRGFGMQSSHLLLWFYYFSSFFHGFKSVWLEMSEGTHWHKDWRRFDWKVYS